MKRRRTTNKYVYKKKENKFLTVPNVLSLFRIALIPVIVWLYAISGNMVWSGVVLIVSGLTDIADGWIARHYNMVSEVGKALDPIADKLTQGAVLLCMIFRYPLLVFPFILLLAKEAFVGVTGLLLIQKSGAVYGAEWHGKAATCLIYAVLLLHLFWTEIPPAATLVSVILASGMMLISLFLYGIRNLKLLKDGQ